MSSPSDGFECSWRPSRRLLLIYSALQILALLALSLIDAPLWVSVPGVVFCLGHAVWVLPRHILLRAPSAFTGLRCSGEGWQVWSESVGWQRIQLRPDSLALPLMVVLRFRVAGRRQVSSLCIAHDAMAHDSHRRLRVRLKFSRRRWAEAE
ncbi:protein YgfX [Pseudomonas borbori]